MTDENPLETKNIAFYSTLVVEGSAVGMVINTGLSINCFIFVLTSLGDDSVIGRIAALAIQTPTKPTPLNREVKKFVIVISIIAILIGVVFLILGLLEFGGITNLQAKTELTRNVS